MTWIFLFPGFGVHVRHLLILGETSGRLILLQKMELVIRGIDMYSLIAMSNGIVHVGHLLCPTLTSG